MALEDRLIQDVRRTWRLGLALALLTVAATAVAQPVPVEPAPTEVIDPLASPDPAVRAAHVEQVLVPQLVARARAARARSEARGAFAKGEGAFSEAYPTLSSEGLGEARTLRGRLGLLDDRAVARANEKVAPVPDVPPRAARSFEEARTDTLTAEARADAMEREMLTAVLAGLERRPGLTTQAIAPFRQDLLVEREQVAAAASVASEEEAPEALRRLASADERLQAFDRAVSDLRLWGAGGGSPQIAPLVELAGQASDFSGVPGLLRALRADLTGAEAEAVDAVLLGVGQRALAQAQALAEPQAPAEDGKPPAVGTAEQALATAQAALATLQGQAAALPEVAFPGDAERRDAMALRLERATQTVQVAQQVLEAAQVAAAAPTTSATQSEADAAKQRAEEARAAAADARERRVAELLGHFANAQAREVDLGTRVVAAERAKRTANADWAATLATIEDRIHQIEQRSALEADRASDADKQHEAVRQLMSTLRASEIVTGDALVQARDLASTHEALIEADRERITDGHGLLDGMSGDAREELESTLDRWTFNLDDEQQVLDRMQADLQSARDVGLLTLHDARLARRALEPYISREQRVADRANLLQDIGQEVSLLPSSVWMMARGRISALSDLGQRLTDYNLIVGLVRGSVWTIVLVVGWYLARGQVTGWAVQLAHRVRRWRPELRMSDVAALKEPTVRFLRNAVDLALGYLLIWSLNGALKEITFLLLVYLQFSMYRVVLALFDLLVVTTGEVRPAAVVLRDDIHALARNTVRWFVGFWIVRGFVSFVTWEVLSLDRITSIVEWVLGWGWWALVAWALWRWQPYLRERVERHGDGHPAVAWLGKDDNNPLFRVPRAIGTLLYFAMRVGVDLLYRGARDGSSLGWLLNTVSRFRLEDEASEEIRVLTDAQLARIVAARTDERHLLHREEVQTAIAAALAEWRRTQRRGLVAIIGDRGSGKKTACQQVMEQMEEAGLKVTVAQLDHRITDEEGMRAWLAEVVGLASAPDTLDALAEAIEALEPQGFELRGIHWAFERRVGGLAAITSMLYVLNSTSDRHFWMVSVHKPAWDWFDSVGSLVDTGVFRSVIRLAPLSSAQLRALTVARMGKLGLRLDFSGLVRSSAFGADPEVELERSTAVFYRLLAESSDGNPTIAMHLFARCLVPTDDDHVVAVRMGAVLSGGVVDSLSESALFVLTALRLQDELTLDEVVEVTNLSLPAVRTTVRDLLSRALVERVGENLRVPDEALQSVSRTLRRRHFMHLGAA